MIPGFDDFDEYDGFAPDGEDDGGDHFCGLICPLEETRDLPIDDEIPY